MIYCLCDLIGSRDIKNPPFEGICFFDEIFSYFN